MSVILRTHQLGKSISGKNIVSNVNLNIKKGEIYGFLGPNGAGKTMVMKMIASLVQPTEGEIEIFGKPLHANPNEILKRMGSIIEYPIFYDKLTAIENLELHCEYMGYYNNKSIAEAIDMVQLVGIDNKPVGQFSLGMRQRLGIARAIITKPELLLLDEPINGLDPVGIRELRNVFTMLSKQYGITILISSHILGEIELIADTIGVINHGKLIEEISMDDLRKTNTEYVEIATTDVMKASFVLADTLNITNMKVAGDNLIRIYDLSIAHNDIFKALTTADVTIDSINRKQNSLEDHFFQILNGGERSA